MDKHTTQFGIDVSDDGVTRTIALSGELDLAVAGELDAAIRAAEEAPVARTVIDLERLLFIDSSGLRVVLAAKRRADATEGALLFTRSHGHVADMLRLTALDQTLSFLDPPSAAAA